MAEPLEDGPLERLRKRLYAPPPVDSVEESTLSTLKPRPAEGWKEVLAPADPAKPKMSGSAIFLIFSVSFFVLAGITTAVVLFLGGRSVSGDQLQIQVEGPTTVSGGESVSLFITVQNNNPTVATNAVLELDFPEGTFTGEDGAEPLLHASIPLGSISAGESVRKTVTAAFFGEENTRVVIPVKVEYETGQSNAVFISNESYGFVIATAPVTLSVSTLSEVASGQPLTLTIRARSNATAPLSNVAVRAGSGSDIKPYPSGFVPSSTSPTAEGNLFVLGTLLPGEEKEIRITGTLLGQEGEERVFHFTVGSLPSSDAVAFTTPYSQKEVPVLIARPFLGVDLAINRSSEDTVVIKTGELVATLVTWQNDLSTSISDARIEVKLEGDALDVSSVDATNGYYRSADRSVLFDRDTERGLAVLEPGDTGSGSFVFSTKTGSLMNALRNPSITMTVSVSGRRVGQGSVSENVSSTLTRTIKVETDLSVSAKATRTTGPFENSGPIPPEADKETTYTIVLNAGNTINTTANTVVTTTLPSYVRYTGLANPTAQIKYNELTRELVWTIGEMAPAGNKTASFQVALLPSVSQKGTSPQLTSEVVVSGYDRFVEQETSSTANPVTTETATDAGYQHTYGIVK